MTLLYLDFETRSEISLPDRGLDNYARHPSTEGILLAYAFGDSPVNLWQKNIHGQLSGELKDAITDPSVLKVSFNAPFEYNILKYVFRTETPYSSWVDVLIWARHLSVTGDLGEVGKVFGLPEDQLKDKEGKRLIKLFCEPGVAAKDTPLFGKMPAWYHDWSSDPDDWQKFGEYCKQDVIAERALFQKMQAFPLPEQEQRGWALDQVINSRGLPCDMELARGSQEVAEQIKTDLRAKMREITGVKNPNSNDQILEWIQTQGYTFSGIGKPFVNRALAGECELTPAAIEVLNLRKQAAKTSDSKLDRITEIISDDERLRHQFWFMGAARTGRWSGGGGVQVQNLPRPTKEVAKHLDTAITLLKNRDYLGLAMEFPSPMDAVAGTIRSVFRASPGKKLLVCDLNAVEFRMLGWITKDEAINSVFRTGRDPYKDFGVDLFGVSYEEITKQQRQDAKPGVLGGGYQLSGGEEYTNEEGDKVYSGLMGYARMMGIEISHDLAHASIAAFREKYSAVPPFWYAIEEAALRAVRNPGTDVSTGFNRDQEIDLPVTFRCFGTKLLRMLLPSGRGLHYIRPKIEKDEKFKKDGVLYWGKDQKTKQWCYQKIYGGKWVENMDQAMSRDLLLNGMFLAENKGLTVVGDTHDELICEVDKDSKFGLKDLRASMIESPVWCKDLILDAEGYESEVYRKD